MKRFEASRRNLAGDLGFSLNCGSMRFTYRVLRSE
jgi:hypothetical protein